MTTPNSNIRTLLEEVLHDYTFTSGYGIDQAETAINAYVEQVLGKDEEYPIDGLAVDVDARNKLRAELRQKFNLTKNGG